MAEPRFFVDVHPQFQRGLDFRRVKALGYVAAICKASQGDSYVPPGLSDYFRRIKDSGLRTGLYHFLEAGPSGTRQAEHFLHRVEALGGPKGRLLVADFEHYAGGDPSNKQLHDFVSKVRRETGQPVGIYTAKSFWEGGDPSGPFSGYGAGWLWAAHYADMDRHDRPQDHFRSLKGWGWDTVGGKRADAHQFTSAGLVAGQYIDVNATYMAGDRLDALAGRGGVPDGQTKPGRIQAPAGVPKEITPAMGDRRGWSPNARRLVEAVESEFEVVCSTYDNHGTTGRAKGVDIWIARMGATPTKAQEEFGDKIQRFLEARIKALNVHYLIYWNWMRYHNGSWFDYSPWSKPASQGGWPHGYSDMDTRKHLDHLHAQVL